MSLWEDPVEPFGFPIFTAGWLDWRDRDRSGEKFLPVRISVGAPRFIEGARQFPHIGELAPYGLLDIKGEDEFEQRFVARMESKGIHLIRKKVVDLAQAHEGTPLALCCFEKWPEIVSGKSPCHRRYWASWWESKTGEYIPDLGEL